VRSCFCREFSEGKLRKPNTRHIIFAVIIAVVASHYLKKLVTIDPAAHWLLKEAIYIGIYSAVFFAVVFILPQLKSRKTKD
jgi:hypothetical protein